MLTNKTKHDVETHQMIRVVFVSRDKDQFVELEQMLTRHNVDVERSGSGKDLMSLLSDTPRENGLTL